MGWTGNEARMVAKIISYNSLVRKPEGKRQFGLFTRSWEDNIKTNRNETGYEGLMCEVSASKMYRVDQLSDY